MCVCACMLNVINGREGLFAQWVLQGPPSLPGIRRHAGKAEGAKGEGKATGKRAATDKSVGDSNVCASRKMA